MTKPSHGMTIVLLVAALLVIAPESEAQKPSPKTLTLGVVFQGQREPLEKHFYPLVNYAARKLAGTDETKGVVLVAPTAGQMVKLLEEKRVDFYMESPYPTYLINRLGAGKLLLRRWKGGMADYRSLFFTSKESGVAKLGDLRGKIIAFEDPGSTSGYFLPKLFLLKKGFSLAEKANTGSKVSTGEVGYIFGNTADDVVSLVLQQKTVAGAFSNDDYAGLEDKRKIRISIIDQTDSVPRHLVSVRKDLPDSTVKNLKEILLKMDQDKDGQQILKQTDNTTKFDLLPGGEEKVRKQLIDLYRPRGGN